MREVAVALPACATAPAPAPGDAMPTWAANLIGGDAAYPVGDSWVLVPQPADPVALAAGPSIAATTETGARLACTVTLPDAPVDLVVSTDRGGALQTRSLGGVGAFALPGLDVAPGLHVRVAASRLDAVCTEWNTPWAWLLTGTPLPLCDETHVPLWDVDVAWNGGPIDLDGHGRCALESRADVDGLAAVAAAAFDEAAARICAAPLTPDGPRAQLNSPWDAAEDAFIATVIAGGWGHPQVRRQVSMLEALRAEWAAAELQQLAADAAAASTGDVPVATELSARVTGRTCAETCFYELVFTATGATPYELDALGAIADPSKGAWGTAVSEVDVVYTDGTEQIASFSGPWTPGPLAPSGVVKWQAPPAPDKQLAFVALRGPDDRVLARLKVP